MYGSIIIIRKRTWDNNYFILDKNIDEYGVNKNIHSAYVEATYQFTEGIIANLGVKYDKVNMDVDYNVNRAEPREASPSTKTMCCPA